MSSRAVSNAAVKTTRIITATIAVELVIHARWFGAECVGAGSATGFLDRTDCAVLFRGAFLVLFTRTNTSRRFSVVLALAEQMRCPAPAGAWPALTR
jgi:hypothetical protein